MTLGLHIPEKQLFRIDETATLLGVSRWTVQRMLNRGELRAVRRGARARRVLRSSIVSYLGSARP